ncbi:A/G-specific adenine glycosylase [Weeksella sp. HMSC059D05]|uniref:A/G-specific adenine glycosylase n=1 Tax=Weeksella sp. HMSC059D05 TaxID=1715139 RepID=UPI0008A3B571|nr:A/G-specific adenine glycosylase [Weeksella sp. HMSC059D05]OFM82835.1 A/G-specific adenine glycosylase [Weeksella sp. HMSC059D05]
MDKKLNANLLILAWFDHNKRILPWRNTKDPYKIWLSEIILQQTRVQQGIAYYESFISHFPTLEMLARADENQVLKLWQGLGYYSRARNLHATAKYLYLHEDSIFPDNSQDLKKLKGIGDYTASAIASICYNEVTPALDGNMYRVFARYFGLYDDITEPATKKKFFALGKEIIDRERPGDFNQAVMDLGAMICTPQNYKCEACPLNESCFALQKNVQNKLPVKLKKITIKNRYLHFIYIHHQHLFLLMQRDDKDVWAKLFSLPKVESRKADDVPIFHRDYDDKCRFLYEETHLLSHQRLHIKFWELEVNEQSLSDLKAFWKAEIVSYQDLERYALPKPIEKFMDLRIFD